MRRVFCVVYLMMMAVAVADCWIRLCGRPPLSLADAALAFLASSVTAVMLAGVVFLAGDAYWFICAPALVWGAACSGMEYLFRCYFSDPTMVGEQLMVSIVTLNQEKVFAFIGENWTATGCVACVVVVVGVLLAVAWMSSRSVGAPTVRSVLCGLVLCVGAGCLELFVMDHDHLMMALLDHVFFRDGDKMAMYRELKEGGEDLESGAYCMSSSNVLAVVVVGESSTRNHWSLYGYPRRTTPRLDALSDELIVFSNVTAEVALTPYALRDLFTSQGNGRIVSVPSAAVSAGYEVSLCSSQPKMGLYEGSDELLFAACGTRRYLCDTLPVASCYDEILIPLVQQTLAPSCKAQIVFVHTYGSHCDWGARIPPSFVGFTQPDETTEGLSSERVASWNAYDTTILYTDHVLAELLEVVRGQDRPAVFAYVSDHGESPRSVRRDHKDSDTHAVPCFIWFSEAYRSQYAERVARIGAIRQDSLSTRSLFPVWMELLGLSRR